MASYPGDPRARPELAICAISTTGAIKHKREELIGRTVVYWLNDNSHNTALHHIIDAMEEKLHIVPRIHHREVPQRGRTFNFKPWIERRGAAESMLEFHVWLRIEGVPVHTWSEEVLAKIVPNCAIHFVEGH
uniref:DUF4283 domain-containing protein n=1 Tax=Setaria italica TaxID=4555 RepID=K3XSD2_SETIT